VLVSVASEFIDARIAAHPDAASELILVMDILSLTLLVHEILLSGR